MGDKAIFRRVVNAAMVLLEISRNMMTRVVVLMMMMVVLIARLTMAAIRALVLRMEMKIMVLKMGVMGLRIVGKVY